MRSADDLAGRKKDELNEILHPNFSGKMVREEANQTAIRPL
jgi:hypothetical protein